MKSGESPRCCPVLLLARPPTPAIPLRLLGGLRMPARKRLLQLRSSTPHSAGAQTAASLQCLRPKAEVSGHAPQAAVAAPSGFQPAAARSSALTSRKWLPRMDSRHQPPGSEPGALAVELQGKTIRQPELHRSLADTSGVRRYQRFGGIGNGRAPRCCPECLPLRRLCRWRSAFRRKTLSRHAFADPNGADCCLPRAR